LGWNDLERTSVFSRPLDRKPDLILIAALYDATDMNAGNIAYAEAFADNTIECVHPLSPFRGLETSLWFFLWIASVKTGRNEACQPPLL